jgi:hypothetical protein
MPVLCLTVDGTETPVDPCLDGREANPAVAVMDRCTPEPTDVEVEGALPPVRPNRLCDPVSALLLELDEGRDLRIPIPELLPDIKKPPQGKFGEAALERVRVPSGPRARSVVRPSEVLQSEFRASGGKRGTQP